MTDDKSTPQGETGAVGTTEPSATPQATGSEVQTSEPAKQQSVEDVEALRAQLQKVEMERNQLRNKQEELAREKEEARLAKLDEVERLREELAKEREEKSVREAKDFRDKVISEYPDEATRKAAKALIEANESNLTWGEVDNYDDAKADLIRQLDAIKQVVIPTKADESAPSAQVHPNNPIPQQPGTPTQDDLMKEAERTGDWSKVLRNIPSINALASTFDEK